MPQSYHLAQTYAPTPDLEERLLALDTATLCHSIGISRSTLERVRKQRTASRQTAQRLAAGLALIDGLNQRSAFQRFFERRPRVVMEESHEQTCGSQRRFRRRDQ